MHKPLYSEEGKEQQASDNQQPLQGHHSLRRI
jgi:hypothetical protein